MLGDEQFAVQFVPQPAYQHVNGAQIGLLHPVGRQHPQQAFAAQHRAWVGDKCQQHFIFGPRQADRLLFKSQSMAGRVEAVTGEQVAVVLLHVAGRGVGQIDPPQQVFHPHHQLTQLQRLGDVVIGPHFQPDDPIDLIAAPGNQNDPDVRSLTQRTG
ncbi:hypothetical protein D3C78_1173110 [compost metagenome]